MYTLALLASAPWIITDIATVVRARRSTSLDDASDVPPPDAPLVSVIVPARNEERNIRRCVESVLASTYPNIEVIALDDHSTDATGSILREIAASDARLRVVMPPALPSDWFGKQWACHTGAGAARGEILAFFDADTWQRSDLLTRAINGMRDRQSDLLSVVGDQEFGSFWERVVQPQIFIMMLTRYGGTEVVNNAARASEKIANGQCMIMRRDAYDDAGGHAAVRGHAAEDLSIAQRWFVLGKRCHLVLGLDQFTTRMYRSLSELRAGWGKNMFASGRETVPFGRVGRALFPFMILVPGLAGVVPPLALALSLLGVLGSSVLAWSAVVTSVSFIFWIGVYRTLPMSYARSLGYALLYPFGAAVMLEICLGALRRGRRVRWKDRDYVAA